MKTFQTLRRASLLLVLSLFTAISVQAMSYSEARDRAWYLTDKMAYELNLTQEQYDKAYQINLDYLMSIQTPDDCTGRYWRYRNADFECILQPWQYALYTSLDYFFRPIRWLRSAWYLPVFEHYRRGFFYFARPTVYVTYVGHDWRRRGHRDPSPYRHFRPGHGPGMRGPGRPGVRPGHPHGNPGYHFTPVGPSRPEKPGRPDVGRPTRPNAPGKPNTGRPNRPNAGKPSVTGRPNQRPQQPGKQSVLPEKQSVLPEKPKQRPNRPTSRPGSTERRPNTRPQRPHNVKPSTGRRPQTGRPVQQRGSRPTGHTMHR